ncbi:SDR family NAD(P)-dependent oxidoreductase [Rubellicoccus peritrichatus]|uniref:SDR family oxidoreductase n=1 Tax=Rubellicoccus peritrichatus TaxID=3080537 RepID=A0AAQ3QUI7_9BACT|nr:SDR family oxidoreductase [Puniceicoccus sp. CR14]WOO39767.1 SDR family oxidoreductase [Puniceicoccus sp. CR14]
MSKLDFQNAFSLKGETALITGGGSGLGLAMATSFCAAGAQVILVGRREQVVKNAATSLGPNAFAIAHDISECERASELMEKAEEVSGSKPSILVNNAGIHLKKLATETNPSEFEAVIQTHVIAAHSLVQAALPAMLEKQHGSILFMASMTSYIGMPKVVAYSAAKSAYVGMVRTLTSEVAEHGVRVNGIAPGWIQSPMLDQALGNDTVRRQKILSRTPMGKFGEPDDIGLAAVYLCSPAAKFVSGVVLPIDGGASIGF